MLLNNPPAAGFDQPFEMLAACHERVERSLQLLTRLVEHLRNAADTPRDREMAASAARDVLRYFDIAAPAHHDDEERHVFPALLALNDAALTGAVERLRADHVAMGSAWAALRLLLEGIAQHGVAASWAALDEAARRFAGLYGEHMVIEEERVFPAARAVIESQGEPAIAAMGREMAGRRQTK